MSRPGPASSREAILAGKPVTDRNPFFKPAAYCGAPGRTPGHTRQIGRPARLVRGCRARPSSGGRSLEIIEEGHGGLEVAPRAELFERRKRGLSLASGIAVVAERRGGARHLHAAPR